MRMPKITSIIWLALVIMLVGIEVAQLTGYIRFNDLLTNFFVFVFALVVISILAVIGSTFLGMFIAHRMLAGSDFTPFETEMLKMHQEVNEIHKTLEKLEEHLGLPKE